MQRKQINFGVRYGNRKDVTEKLNGKELKGLKIHLELLRTTLKNVLNWKTPVYHKWILVKKNSRLFTTDCFFNRVDALKKQIYPMRLSLSRKTPKKEPSPAFIDQ